MFEEQSGSAPASGHGTGAVDPMVTTGPPPYVDFDPEGYLSRACDDCASWWYEFTVDDLGRSVVREWHDPLCRTLVEWR